MNCRQYQELLDDLLIVERDEFDRPEAAEHLAECPDCARQHELSLAALEAIAWSHPVSASAGLKQRIIDHFPDAEVAPLRRKQTASFAAKTWRTAMLLATAAMVLLAISIFRGGERSASGLLAEATAAEARFFAVGQIVHLVNEIVVPPVADATLSQARWLPLMSVSADGKPQVSQLSVAAEPGKGYTVIDRSWYDPESKRFARVLTVRDRTLFANSFDGQAVYTVTTDPQGKQRIDRAEVGKDFHAPTNPAEFLGIAAGVTSPLEQQRRTDLVSDAGKTKLADGSEARVLKLSYPQQDAPKQIEAFYRIVIREDDHTIDSIEFLAQGQSLFVVRRGKPASPISDPDVGWDLAKLDIAADSAPAALSVKVLSNLVVPNVSLDDMAQRADFQAYMFTRDPAWAGERQITDILDVVNPPHRMFSTIYRAKDRRHVVLVQGQSFNQNLAAAVEAGKLIYTSPSGVKVYSTPAGQWLANILLESMRFVVAEAPAEDRHGYMLKTPEGTIAMLAINGQLSDEELHSLVDDLAPLKKQ